MQKLKLLLITSITFLMIAGCQTIKEKTDAIVEKENEKLSKYISKPASVLQMDLGKPDEDFKNAKGNFEFIYNTKYQNTNNNISFYIHFFHYNYCNESSTA